MRRCPVQECVACRHLTITVSASIKHHSAHLIRTLKPTHTHTNKNKCRKEKTSPYPVQDGRAACAVSWRVSLVDVVMCKSVNHSGRRADAQDEKETAEDGGSVCASPLLFPAQSCALQRPWRYMTRTDRVELCVCVCVRVRVHAEIIAALTM